MKRIEGVGSALVANELTCFLLNWQVSTVLWFVHYYPSIYLFIYLFDVDERLQIMAKMHCKTTKLFQLFLVLSFFVVNLFLTVIIRVVVVVCCFCCSTIILSNIFCNFSMASSTHFTAFFINKRLFVWQAYLSASWERFLFVKSNENRIESNRIELKWIELMESRIQ